MPALTIEQVAEQWKSAWDWEWSRRSNAAGGFLAEPSMQEISDINGVAAMAVARLQYVHAAPATPERVVKMQRMARHLDHTRNQITEHPPLRSLLDLMYSSIVALTTVGADLTQWEAFADTFMEMATDLVASVVANDHATLMPAENDHD
jgi:hypothetical protein